MSAAAIVAALPVPGQEAIVTDRECRASISGLCLMVTHGSTLCREGECDGEVMDEWAKDAAASAGPVRRARRIPVRAALPVPGQEAS